MEGLVKYAFFTPPEILPYVSVKTFFRQHMREFEETHLVTTAF